MGSQGNDAVLVENGRHFYRAGGKDDEVDHLAVWDLGALFVVPFVNVCGGLYEGLSDFGRKHGERKNNARTGERVP